MKYSCEIELELPRAKVIELFDNVDNLKSWQPELVSFEPLTGTPGQVGATSKLVYKTNNRTMELVETITERNLPSRFCGTYETKGVTNYMVNIFDDIGGRTRWTSEVEFQFNGLFMKAIGFFMPWAFKKTTMKFMTQFKAFAESAK